MNDLVKLLLDLSTREFVDPVQRNVLTNNAMVAAAHAIEAQDAKLKVAVEALEWYGDDATIAYQTKPNAIGTFAKDNGVKAREALARIKEGG